MTQPTEALVIAEPHQPSGTALALIRRTSARHGFFRLFRLVTAIGFGFLFLKPFPHARH